MTIRFVKTDEKTNSFHPTGWYLEKSPFPAYRAYGTAHRAFVPWAKNYTPTLEMFEGWMRCNDEHSRPPLWDRSYSKIIKTQKGGLLIVPAVESTDEKLLFVTFLGGFRGGFSRIEAFDAELLYERSSSKHCTPSAHVIVRLKNDGGYVLAESGRRKDTGFVEVVTWDEYLTMPTEEAEAWQEMYHCGGIFPPKENY